ncbi:MAG: hypothetical protein MHM6MM_002449 [Cercozoa sp. M6MM]
MQALSRFSLAARSLCSARTRMLSSTSDVSAFFQEEREQQVLQDDREVNFGGHKASMADVAKFFRGESEECAEVGGEVEEDESAVAPADIEELWHKNVMHLKLHRVASVSSHEGMQRAVDSIELHGNDEAVKRSIELVDRGEFVPSWLPNAYELSDTTPIGHGAALVPPFVPILCMRLLAHTLRRHAEQQQSRPVRILNLGTATGYVPALLAMLARECGCSDVHVQGVEHVAELAEVSRSNLSRVLADTGVCWDVATDCMFDPQLEWHTELYDVVLINGGVAGVEPLWMRALRPGGRLVVPLGLRDQTLMLTCKGEDEEVKRWKCVSMLRLPSLTPPDSVGNDTLARLSQQVQDLHQRVREAKQRLSIDGAPVSARELMADKDAAKALRKLPVLQRKLDEERRRRAKLGPVRA